MKNKKGMSMISLIITVIVILILLATSIGFMGNAVDNSRISAFANDLVEIEDAVRTYYVEKDEFPTSDSDKNALSQNALLGLISDGKSYLEDELKLNGDYIENGNLGAFYKIDLSKIGVASTKRGTKDSGDTSDIYVVSYPSLNVYYVKGIEAKSKFYFSLSSNLTSIVKINKGTGAKVNDYTKITSSQGITVRKEAKEWTNKVNMYVESFVENGETLYIKIGDGTENQLNVVSGQNKIYFGDSFKSYNSLNQNKEFNISNSTIDNDIENFSKKIQKDKKITIMKKKSGSVVATLVVDFSNFELTAPVKTQAALLTSKEEYNLLTLKMQDYDSGIKEVRYEYLTKYDSDGNIVSYYDNISRYDVNYMRARSKVAKLASDGVVELEVPKNVASVQIVAIDKAGNITQKDGTSYIIEETSPYIYVGIEEVSVTRKEANINFVVRSDSEVKSAKCYTSTDGVNFSNERVLKLKKETSSVYKDAVNYNNLNGITNKIYIKVEVIYLDTNEKEVRIKEIELTSNPLYSTTTCEIAPSTGNTLTFVIPAGFTPVTLNTDGTIKEYVKMSNWNNTYFNDKKIKEGIVIVDRAGNEFVWIPIESSNYKSRFSEYPKYTSITSVKDEKSYELKYGGFYVSRYEAAFSYNNGNIAAMSKKSTNITQDDWSTKRTPAYEGYLWNYVSYEEAKNYSRKMAIRYGYTGVKTDLINGTQWDSLLYFLSQNSYNVSNSTSFGNYGSGTISSPNGTLLLNSASSIKYSTKNIYDLAGNLSEYTNEHPNGTSNKAVIRGGSYMYSGSAFPLSYRNLLNTNEARKDVGFRIVMCFE